jgi:GAF domain-containing protein
VRRHRTTGRKPVKAQQTIKPKRGVGSKVARNRRPSALSKNTEIARLARELAEALEQQQATSEVLRVISSSFGELEPVFRAILANATQLCEANFGNLWLCEGDAFRIGALHNAPPAYGELRQREPVIRPGPETALGRMSKTKQAVHYDDATRMPGYHHRDPVAVATADLLGARTFLAVPMLKENELIGAITIYRQEVRPFSDKQIALLQNFASQAVIAIENTRLLKELRQRTNDLSESLEQQTATAEVLSVISSSPGELEPVFNSMLDNATRICEAKFGTLYLRDGDSFRAVAMHNPSPLYAKLRQREPLVRPPPDSVLGCVSATKQVAHITDMRKVQSYVEGNPYVVAGVDLGGSRTALGVPMLKQNNLIGVVNIYRQEVRPFADKQIELVKNFAAQAVIAIENTRLLNELRESLQQQTATADVLKVISRSTFDLQAVLDTLVS